MFRAQPQGNTIVAAKWDERVMRLHKQRLRTVKSVLDNKEPAYFRQSIFNAKRAQVEEGLLACVRWH